MTNSPTPEIDMIDDTLSELSNDIDAIIGRLLDHRQSGLKPLLLIQLMMWMRFSAEPDKWRLACLVGFLSYARGKRGNMSLSAMDPEISRAFLSVIDIDTILSALYAESKNFPNFDLDVGQFTDIDDLTYTARLAEYLLWMDQGARDSDAETPSSISGAPIAKASEDQNDRQRTAKRRSKLHMGYHVLTLRAEEGSAAPRSWSTFMNDWKLNRNAAAFLYVGKFHSNFDFLIHPKAPDFAQQIDRMAGSTSELERFLGQAHWAGQKLFLRLETKAKRGIKLPSFPAGFQPEVITGVSLPPRVAEVLQDYDPNVYEFEEDIS